MEEYQKLCRFFFEATRLPLAVCDGEGQVQFYFPEISLQLIPAGTKIYIDEYRERNLHMYQPLIKNIKSRYFFTS
ncbi:hypothetical protein P22_3160 [Propionispora sp. 2/2-37]|nr:hypothetical protein P22_3160 [Propionispora sp. 2/2-37]